MELSEVIIKCRVKFFGALEDPEKEKLDEFFLKYRENNIVKNVTIGPINKIKEDFRYEDDLYEVQYLLNYGSVKDHSALDRSIGDLCRKWCDEKEIPHLGWLTTSKNEGFLIDENEQDINIKVSEISFGTIPNMTHFVQHYRFREKSPYSDISSSFYHLYRYFSLFISQKHKKECSRYVCREEETFYKMDCQYKSFSRIIAYIAPGFKPVEIYFYLEHIPFIYKKIKKDEENHAKYFSDTSNALKSAAVNEITHWERVLEFGCKCSNTSCKLMEIGRATVLKIVIPDKYRSCRLIHRISQRCSSRIKLYYGALETLVIYHEPRNFYRHVLEKFRHHKNLKEFFHCEYSWEAIFSWSLVINDQLLLKHNQLEKSSKNFCQHFKEKVQNYMQIDHNAFSSALDHIYYMIKRNSVFNFEIALDKLFTFFKTNNYQEELPDGVCLVRRIVVTPSRYLLIPRSEHFDNRVIRKFSSEYMLRLSAEDDNFSKLTFGLKFQSDKEKFLNIVLGNILRNSIIIGSRKYEILASSISQLREHGLWMFATDQEQKTANCIRKWMGNFAPIKNVAKYMARMGQCFSTSDSASQLTLKKENEVNLNEIRSGDGRYIFSDGIGMMSCLLADEVRKTLAHRQKLILPDELIYKPSAFQIRYKGCKGMAVEAPLLSGEKIGIRPSMDKFECNSSNTLEIVKTSAPRMLFLNRPLITILEQLGVPSKVFIDLQTRMILNLTDSLIYESKAVETLTNYLSIKMPFQELHENGFLLTKDSFFRSVLLALYKDVVDQLKLKTRISVPPEYGRNMLGVLDETKTLNYGEVFIQYSGSLNQIASPLKILKGSVVVTKNPCMHPGDVRKLHAVDVPKLHHIKDCVVFPAKGKRPHPDEMAGSDLDGDEYVVIWHPDLIFPYKNVDPMDYPSNFEISHVENIGVEEMIKFFCNYIQNDHIGSFGSAHMAWADWNSEGIFSDVCLQIAQKYPLILDFAKTGYSVQLESHEKPKRYPDFMEKGHTKDSYWSKRSLGMLYRMTRHLQACVGDMNLGASEFSFDCYLEYPGWEIFEEWAENMRVEYMGRIVDVLNKYGINSEIEALIGHVKLNWYDQNRYDAVNTRSVLKATLKDIMFKFQLKLWNAIETDSRNQTFTYLQKKVRKLQRASALYMVVYKKKHYTAVSLPWIAADILIDIRRECLILNSITLERLECSLMTDGDTEIKALLSVVTPDSSNIQIPPCQCVSQFKIILLKWLTKYELNLSASSENFCCDCFERIFKEFSRYSKCCSSSSSEESACMCFNSCSVIKYTLQFFKFCLLHVTSPLGKCYRPGCLGFIETNLQSVALQTYALLATRRCISFLGIKDFCCDDSKNDSIECFQGDPVRLPVTSDTLKNIITGHKEKVQKFLKEKSGVKKINLLTVSDNRKKWHLLIYSYGKSWQCWNLEELVLNPNLTQILQQVINQAE